MHYRPSSFRKTAFALTAAAALAGLSALSSFPANAQQTVSYSTTPDCATIIDGGKRAVCESFKRTEEAKKRGAEADRRGAAADEIISCLKDLGRFKEKNPDGFARLGAITRETACSVAAKIRPTASLN
jgi:hypothetical protein